MDSQAETILKNVKLGQWSLQEVKIYIENSAIKERKAIVRFSENFLRTVASYMYGFMDTGLPKQTSELSVLLDIVYECHDVILDARKKNLKTNNALFIQRSLYHIMQYLVKWNLNFALLGLQRMYEELNSEQSKLEPDIGSSDWKTVVQNCYLLLWNAAIVVEKRDTDTEFNVQSFNLRQEALKYLILSSPLDFVKYCGQATKAAKAYHSRLKYSRCSNLEKFFKDIYISLQQHVNSSRICTKVTISSDLLKESFNFIVCWLDYMMQHNFLTEAEKLIKSFISDVVEKLVESLCTKSKTTYLGCINLILVGFHFHPQALQNKELLISTNMNDLFKQCLNLNHSVDYKFTECIVLSLSMLRKQIGTILEILPKNLNIVERVYLHLDKLKCLLQLYGLPGHSGSNEISTEASKMALHNLITFYGRLLHICFWCVKYYLQNDQPSKVLDITTILNTFVDLSEQYDSLIDVCDKPRDYINFYVTLVGNLSTVCYNNGWFENVVCILKPCLKYYKDHMLIDNDKTAAFSNVELLVHCLRQLKRYKSALYVIAEMLSFGTVSQKKLLVLWAKVKRDAKSHDPKDESLIQMTSKELVAKFLLPGHDVDFVKLLKCEAAVYKTQTHNTSLESLSVYEALLRCCPDGIYKADVLIELAELQLGICNVATIRTCKNHCQEAIKLLKLFRSKGKKVLPSVIDCSLAHAYFILHLCESQEVEFSYEEETDIKALQREQTRIEKESPENKNSLPVYNLMTVEMECESVHSLDIALNMWSVIIDENPRMVPNAINTVIELKTTAEMYSLMRMVSNEIKALKLIVALGKATNNHMEYGLAIARLVSLLSHYGLIHDAADYLSSYELETTELDCTSEESSYLSMSLLLAKSELLLMQNNIANGWECLKRVIVAFDSFKVRSMHFDLLWSEMQLLRSQFCELPRMLFPCEFEHGDSPITFAVDGLRCCLQLVRRKSSYSLKYSKVQLLYFKKRMMTLLLDCTLRVGHLYHDIGAPREARCFLNEQLIWSQKLSLAVRTAELLMILARVDILCDNYSNCKFKLNGIANMLESVSKKRTNLSTSELQSDVSRNCQTDMMVEQSELQDSDDCFIINTVVTSNRRLASSNSSSPEASPTIREDFLGILENHCSYCLCIKCKQFVFHRLRFEVVCLQAECLSTRRSTCKEALMFMTEILKHADSCSESEKSALFDLLRKEAKQKKRVGLKKQNSVEPILQVKLIICRILCKMSCLYLENNDLNTALITVHKAYQTLSAMPWLGIGQTHSLLATIIYLYCIIKLGMINSNQGLFEVLDRNWFLTRYEPNSSDDAEVISAAIENINLNSELCDNFKTPLNFQKLTSKRKCNSKAANDLLANSRCDSAAYMKNGSCNAPLKKNLLLSFYENDFERPDKEPNLLAMLDRDPSSNGSKALLNPLKSTTPLGDRSNTELEDCSPRKKMDIISANNVADSSVLSPIMSKGSAHDPIQLSSSTDSDSLSASIRKTRSTSKENLGRRKRVQHQATYGQIKTRSVNKKKIQVARLQQDHITTSLADVLLQCSEFIGAEAELSRRINSSNCCLNYQHCNQCNDVKKSNSYVYPDSGYDAAKSFFKHMFSGSELFMSKYPAPPKRNRKTRSKNTVNNLSDVIADCQEFSFSSAVGYLEKALSLIHHHPPVPLYSNLNMLLALLKGECSSRVSYHLFEANAVTLRHQTIAILASKIGLLEKECYDEPASESKRLIISKLYKRKMELVYGDTRYNDWDKQMKEICDKLPADWTVCQINSLPGLTNGYLPDNQKLDLIITRLRHAAKPLVVKIPYESTPGVSNFLQEFDSVLKASSQSVRLTDRKLWWETRYGLDQRLQTLLDSIENKWLGQWKGLLLGRLIHADDESKLKDVTARIAGYLKSLGFNDTNLELLEVLVDSIRSLQSGHLRRAMAAILKLTYRDPVLRDVCLFVQRCHKYLAGEDVSRHPVILILDKKLQQLPWENIPILRSHPSTRLPSIHFLLGHLKLYEDSIIMIGQTSYLKSICTTNTFFVLNPDSNLVQTEERFRSYFESLNWKGITGERPSVDQWHDCLANKELFVYCGHGSGNHFLRTDALRKVDCKACALLIGCSSGKLDIQGHVLEPRGVVQQYLVAGCPSVVANLWDVTDKDIDRYLEKLLKNWLPGANKEEKCLSRCVAIARQICHLPYMIGASPVVYGLPVRAT